MTPPPHHNTPRVAVVGAGLAGAACAATLRDAGLAPEIFEKSRGPGGRAATRFRDHDRFDHGAQYFTVRTDEGRAALNRWTARGVAARWDQRHADLHGTAAEPRVPRAERFVGVPGMNALAADLIDGITARTGSRITRLEREHDRWTLTDADGNAHRGFRAVAVTAPAPQSAELLAHAPALASAAARVRYEPCWALMLRLREPAPIPFDALRAAADGPIAWMARDSSKPGRPEGERWVVHASHDWSLEHLELEPVDALSRLAPIVAEVLGTGPDAFASADAHRWRYAFAENPLGEPCLWDERSGLGAAGDWCLAPRVEDALRSGLALGRRIAAALA